MSRLREMLTNGLRKAALRSGRIVQLIKSKPGVRVLMHHGVGTREFSTASFEEQIKWLRANFEVIRMEDLISCLRESRSLPAAAVVLTFDDGCRNNATHALPVLRQHAAPASFFVCTNLATSGEWIWTAEMRARVPHIDKARLPEHGQCADFVDWMKTLGVNARQVVVQQVRDLTPHWSPSAIERAENDLMRWPEIEALDRSLITVGSHTATHPILPSLDDHGIERELGGSLADLRAHGLAQDRPLLCYPNGDHDYRVLDAARRHYHGACMTMKGLVNAGTAPHELPRIGANSPLHDVAWRMWRAAS